MQRPDTVSRRRLEDEFYKIMSKFSNSQWKEFARSKQRGLNLQDFQIDDIRADYAHDIREQKYQMLSLWQRRNGRKATVEYLDELVNSFLRTQLPHHEGRRVNAELLTYDVGDRVPEADSSGSIAQVLNQPTDQTQARPHESMVHRDPSSLPVHANASYEADVHGSSLTQRHFSSHSSNDSRAYGRARDTIPKQSAKVPSLDQALSSLHMIPGIMNNSNINITVTGSNAVGMQTNYYYDKKKETTKPIVPVPIPARLGEYCSKVETIKVIPADKEEYEAHFSKPNEIYKVLHKPKGAVLIINNSFPGAPDERHGSQTDVTNMIALWEAIGCKVFPKTEITAAETLQTLSRFSSSPAARSADFVAVVIMSHGGQVKGEDVFFGVDRETVGMKKVLELFNNKNARKLQGVPKLFFLQFCRGQEVDMGTEHMATAEETEAMLRSLTATVQETNVNAGDSTDTIGIQTSKQPTSSDIMVSYATQAGFRAFRNNENGSWYINAIINVFMSHSHNEHILDMMTRVNHAVASKTAHNPDDRAVHDGKEMSDFNSTLRKKLFLFPSFPLDHDEEEFA